MLTPQTSSWQLPDDQGLSPTRKGAGSPPTGGGRGDGQEKDRGVESRKLDEGSPSDDAAQATPASSSWDDIKDSRSETLFKDKNSEDKGTLVDSDFTDKWFQAQAEDLGEVDLWLARQVEGVNLLPQGFSLTRYLVIFAGISNDFPFKLVQSSSSTFSRKHRLSDEDAQQGSQEDGSVGAGDGGEGRGGSGELGRPAHACGRNGQSARALKRRKAAHSSLREEEDEEEEDVYDEGVAANDGSADSVADNGVSPGGELQENTQETTAGSRWSVSSSPSAASPEVRHSAMTLLLEIGMGEGTFLEYSESTAWMANLLEVVKGSSWGNTESLQANNLFAAKINSILHHKRLCQRESGQVQKASLRPILGKLIQDEKLQLGSLLRWYSAGSRWGRLASGGTLYLLMVIAPQGKRVTSTTIVELSNMLRYPQTPVRLLSNHHYFQPLLKQFFSTAMALPRLNGFWLEFLKVTPQVASPSLSPESEEPVKMYSLCPMTTSYLGVSQVSYESDSEDEKDNLGDQSDLPILVDNFTTRGQVDVLFSTFSYAKSAKGKKKYPFTKINRQSWMEDMRQKAEEGTVANTLDELAQGMRTRFYDDKEVSGKPGCLKNSQWWLRPAELSLIQRDKTKPGRNMFTTFHFSTWEHYGQNGLGAPAKVHPTFLRQANGSKTNTSQFFIRSSQDLQVHAEEYDLVCEILGELLERIVKKVLHLFPEDLKNVEANVDIFPLNDHSPVKPFTSFVLNLNVETVAHKDNGDNSLCIVLDLESYTVIHSDKDGLSYVYQ
ncbi:hypothetical protein C8R42DRAFT_638890 [Lentinula raphanica]|nr:hypothetical protein C8R42DRAFT_638890 [Lentinula raphanica]